MAVFCHAADNHHVHQKVCDGSSDFTASTQTSTRSRSCAATEAPELWGKLQMEVTEFDEVFCFWKAVIKDQREKNWRKICKKKKDPTRREEEEEEQEGTTFDLHFTSKHLKRTINTEVQSNFIRPRKQSLGTGVPSCSSSV